MYRPGQYQYQMGYTLSEFGRVLQGNFTATPSPWQAQKYSASQWQVSHRHLPFAIQIELQQLAPRKIALLCLPVLQVTFKPTIADEQTEQLFFQTFFKYFHKGGG